MKRKFSSPLKISFVLVILLGFYFQPSDAGFSENPRKIVVFNKWFYKEVDQDVLLKKHGAVKIKHLKLINGTAVHLSRQAEKALRRTDEVLRIDDDIVIHATGKRDRKKPKNPQPPEELTWGVERVGADSVWGENTGSEIKVAILDTGIDLEHPDLQDNIKGDINVIKPKKSGNDDSGHGTHVAGIVAALDNEIGVIGTGPEISLFAVKVLDKKGRGWLSDLIDGLDWCIDYGMQVVNMSFGSSADNESFHEVVIEAYEAGITLVASAGNNGEYGGGIDYPARYPETIAVSAIDETDGFASFSSYGPEIDLTAPGVNVKSTYKGSSYEIMNGTSMSAPHVTGIVALILKTPASGYDIDNDGIWDPAEIIIKLKETAEILPVLHLHQQGAGLVRADRAAY
ncbi:MAG: S8 family peptidase [Candidatus Aminicenantes bacterium]|nr:MAG: S8 family peptidase [Candidatus Aminicenantes bacterium]